MSALNSYYPCSCTPYKFRIQIAILSMLLNVVKCVFYLVSTPCTSVFLSSWRSSPIFHCLGIMTRKFIATNTMLQPSSNPFHIAEQVLSQMVHPLGAEALSHSSQYYLSYLLSTKPSMGNHRCLLREWVMGGEKCCGLGHFCVSPMKRYSVQSKVLIPNNQLKPSEWVKSLFIVFRIKPRPWRAASLVHLAGV